MIREGRFRVDLVDGLDPDQAKVPLALFWGPNQACDLVTRSEGEPSDLRLRHIDVAPATVCLSVLPQHAVAVVDDGEDAAGHDVPVVLRGGLQHLHDQLLPLGHRTIVVRDPHFNGQLQQLFISLAFYFG